MSSRARESFALFLDEENVTSYFVVMSKGHAGKEMDENAPKAKGMTSQSLMTYTLASAPAPAALLLCRN